MSRDRADLTACRTPNARDRRNQGSGSWVSYGLLLRGPSGDAPRYDRRTAGRHGESRKSVSAMSGSRH